MISLDDALALIHKAAVSQRTEVRPLARAMGSVLAEAVVADRDYPPFPRSMMDGFALSRQFLLDHPMHVFPVAGRILAGSEAPESIPEGCAIRIMTGAPVPGSLDLVIPLENAEISEDGRGSALVCFPAARERPPSPFANISRQGEDCRAGYALLRRGTMVSAATASVLAAVGATQVRVFAPPRVGLITTGSELVDAAAQPLAHQIRDSNGWTVRAFLQAHAIEPDLRLCVSDTREKLRTAIEELMHCDILILTGAVSTGDTDFVPELLAEAGVRRIFHGVSIKPGKPAWFGAGPSGPVIGLPGNPFAVQCGMRIFVLPLLHRSLGLDTPSVSLPLAVSRRGPSSARDEFFPVAVVSSDRGLSLQPLAHRGSGDIAAAAFSDGIGLHPAGQSHLNAGDAVRFFAWNAAHCAGPSFWGNAARVTESGEGV